MAGVYSTGVNASWYPENTAATDATPTFGQVKCTPAKGAAWVFGSFEVLDDTNVAQQLPTLFADAKDRLEAGTFATGAGTNEPLGLLTALGTGVGATGTQTVSTLSLTGMNLIYGVVAPRWRQSSSFAFLGHLNSLNVLRQLPSFSTSTQPLLFGNTLQVGNGVTAYEDSAFTTATGTGSSIVLFGDFQQNIIVDRVGSSVIYEPLVSSSGSYLPLGAAGWYFFWRSGTTVTTTGTGDGPFRGLKV